MAYHIALIGRFMSPDSTSVKQKVKLRSAFYIDGFNLYHAINDLNEPFLKWVNLWRMAETLIPRETEEIVKVVFCTAFYPGDERKKWRHIQYNTALEVHGVSCVFGHYVIEPGKCNNCGAGWDKPSEKQTDINLAISLFHDSCKDVFDKAYLVTADSDQAATARFLKNACPEKKLITVAPPGRNYSTNIANFCDGRLQISRDVLERSLFGAVEFDGEGKSARRPNEYAPPEGWVAPHLRK